MGTGGRIFQDRKTANVPVSRHHPNVSAVFSPQPGCDPSSARGTRGDVTSGSPPHAWPTHQAASRATSHSHGFCAHAHTSQHHGACPGLSRPGFAAPLGKSNRQAPAPSPSPTIGAQPDTAGNLKEDHPGGANCRSQGQRPAMEADGNGGCPGQCPCQWPRASALVVHLALTGDVLVAESAAPPRPEDGKGHRAR